MKRLITAVAAAGLLAIGAAGVAMAAPYEADDTPGTAWACPAWTGTFGNYDPATNPSLARIAEKLGMSAADLSKELQAGKSVAELAAAKGVDTQAIVDVLIAPQKEMMAIRQKYGFLTQEQADLAIQNTAAAAKARLELKGYFGGFGGMMGRGMTGGGMMGGGMMGPGALRPNVAPGTGLGPGMMGGGFGRGMMGGWQNRAN